MLNSSELFCPLRPMPPPGQGTLREACRADKLKICGTVAALQPGIQ